MTMVIQFVFLIKNKKKSSTEYVLVQYKVNGWIIAIIYTQKQNLYKTVIYI